MGHCGKCYPSAKGKTQMMQKELAIDHAFEYDFDTHSHPQSILLGVTNDCNLKCSYCFVTQNPAIMSLETARKGAKWFIDQYNGQHIPSINFFGGEPLMRFDEIIVPIIEEFKSTCAFGITTNGVLLDEDKIDYFAKYGITPLLSFDGIPAVQNVQRELKEEGGKSFDAMIGNIPYLLLRHPDSVMRMTLTAASIPHLYESFIMGEELGFKEIAVCPQAFEEWGDAEQEILQEQLDKIGLKVYTDLVNLRKATKVGMLVAGVEYYQNWETNSLKFNNAILRCGLGTTSAAITPGGDIIPCQEKTSKPTFIIGNVDEGIIPEKHKEYLDWYWEKVHTVNCEETCDTQQMGFCLADICPARLEDTKFRRTGAECVYNKCRSKTAKRLHQLCSGSINPVMQEYFKGGVYETHKSQNNYSC